MKRLDTLPPELRDWIAQHTRQDLKKRMASSVARRASKEKIDVQPAALSGEIERLDSRYFALQEAGKKVEAMSVFRLARALSCLHCLNVGEEDEAAYEFIHSLDELTPAAATAETTEG